MATARGGSGGKTVIAAKQRRGEVGCSLSHMGVWSRVESLGAPVALVIEDDVDFNPRFSELLRATLMEVAGLVDAGVISEPDALYLARKAMRPENDRLLPRACECSTRRFGTVDPQSCPVRSRACT